MKNFFQTYDWNTTVKKPNVIKFLYFKTNNHKAYYLPLCSQQNSLCWPYPLTFANDMLLCGLAFYNSETKMKLCSSFHHLSLLQHDLFLGFFHDFCYIIHLCYNHDQNFLVSTPSHERPFPQPLHRSC